MKPLVPPEINLQEFRFMPLDVSRLWDSELATTASGDAFRAAVLLWCKAWHQVPAGSLPDDERALMKFAACNAETWSKIRDDAMHGFVLCDDGRYYHPVVCEKAIDAWERTNRYRNAANKRWKNKKKLKDASHIKRIEVLDKTHIVGTGTGTGTNKKEDIGIDDGFIYDADGNSIVPPGPEKITKPNGKHYAFFASTIKLTDRDFSRWVSAFPLLDIRAELTALDDFYTENGIADWFVRCSAALAKKNREAAERSKAQGVAPKKQAPAVGTPEAKAKAAEWDF